MGRRLNWGRALILVAASVPVVWRRRRPLAVLAVTFAALLSHEALGYPQAPLLSTFVALIPWQPMSAARQHVTIRHLLGMRSGIPDYTQPFGFIDGIEEDLLQHRARHWTTGELLAIAARAQPDFPPGQRFAYSNTNYILLGEVIAAATGRPWWQALEQRVLEPLGLEKTTMLSVDEVAAVAAGHADLDRDAVRDSLARRPYHSVVTAAGAAGALVSTAGELTTFAHGAFGGTLLSDASLQAMTHVEPEGYERQYGLGVFVQRPDLRTRVIGHTGAGIGYSSVLWYAPEHDVAIAVLVNDSVAEPEELAELLLRQIHRRATGRGGSALADEQDSRAGLASSSPELVADIRVDAAVVSQACSRSAIEADEAVEVDALLLNWARGVSAELRGGRVNGRRRSSGDVRGRAVRSPLLGIGFDG